MLRTLLRYHPGFDDKGSVCCHQHWERSTSSFEWATIRHWGPLPRFWLVKCNCWSGDPSIFLCPRQFLVCPFFFLLLTIPHVYACGGPSHLPHACIRPLSTSTHPCSQRASHISYQWTISDIAPWSDDAWPHRSWGYGFAKTPFWTSPWRSKGTSLSLV